MSASHRRDACDAASEAIELLKARVPIWKKESFVEGESGKVGRCGRRTGWGAFKKWKSEKAKIEFNPCPGDRAVAATGGANAMVTGLARVVVVASSSRGRGARRRGGGRWRERTAAGGRDAGGRGRDSADSRPGSRDGANARVARATESFAGVDEVVVERNLRAVSTRGRFSRPAARGRWQREDDRRRPRWISARAVHAEAKRREADAAVLAGRVFEPCRSSQTLDERRRVKLDQGRHPRGGGGVLNERRRRGGDE